MGYHDWDERIPFMWDAEGSNDDETSLQANFGPNALFLKRKRDIPAASVEGLREHLEEMSEWAGIKPVYLNRQLLGSCLNDIVSACRMKEHGVVEYGGMSAESYAISYRRGLEREVLSAESDLFDLPSESGWLSVWFDRIASEHIPPGATGWSRFGMSPYAIFKVISIVPLCTCGCWEKTLESIKASGGNVDGINRAGPCIKAMNRVWLLTERCVASWCKGLFFGSRSWELMLNAVATLPIVRQLDTESVTQADRVNIHNLQNMISTCLQGCSLITHERIVEYAHRMNLINLRDEKVLTRRVCSPAGLLRWSHFWKADVFNKNDRVDFLVEWASPYDTGSRYGEDGYRVLLACVIGIITMDNGKRGQIIEPAKKMGYSRCHGECMPCTPMLPGGVNTALQEWCFDAADYALGGISEISGYLWGNIHEGWQLIALSALNSSQCARMKIGTKQQDKVEMVLLAKESHFGLIITFAVSTNKVVLDSYHTAIIDSSQKYDTMKQIEQIFIEAKKSVRAYDSSSLIGGAHLPTSNVILGELLSELDFTMCSGEQCAKPVKYNCNLIESEPPKGVEGLPNKYRIQSLKAYPNKNPDSMMSVALM